MGITPLDVRKQEFRRRLRGLDTDDVRSFLDLVATEMESIKRENAELKEDLKAAEDRLGHYRLIERNLQDAALTVQKALEETRRQAVKEAELIVREAHARVEAEAAQLHERTVRLRDDIGTLEMQKANFFLRLRAILRSQVDLLEAMEADSEPLGSSGRLPIK